MMRFPWPTNSENSPFTVRDKCCNHKVTTHKGQMISSINYILSSLCVLCNNKILSSEFKWTYTFIVLPPCTHNGNVLI